MVIGHIQKSVENLLGPNICGMFAAGRTAFDKLRRDKTTLTGMRNEFNMSAIFTLVDMAA